MKDELKNTSKFIEYSKQGILSKELIKNSKLNLTLFCMAKGTAISEHTSTREGFIYVIEGKGIFKLKNKRLNMSPKVLINLSKNTTHSIKADENTSFLLLLS